MWNGGVGGWRKRKGRSSVSLAISGGGCLTENYQRCVGFRATIGTTWSRSQGEEQWVYREKQRLGCAFIRSFARWCFVWMPETEGDSFSRFCVEPWLRHERVRDIPK